MVTLKVYIFSIIPKFWLPGIFFSLWALENKVPRKAVKKILFFLFVQISAFSFIFILILGSLI